MYKHKSTPTRMEEEEEEEEGRLVSQTLHGEIVAGIVILLRPPAQRQGWIDHMAATHGICEAKISIVTNQTLK